jgi:hypothetical protein
MTALVVVFFLIFFYDILSNWGEVISHCGFDLHFSDDFNSALFTGAKTWG